MAAASELYPAHAAHGGTGAEPGGGGGESGGGQVVSCRELMWKSMEICGNLWMIQLQIHHTLRVRMIAVLLIARFGRIIILNQFEASRFHRHLKSPADQTPPGPCRALPASSVPMGSCGKGRHLGDGWHPRLLGGPRGGPESGWTAWQRRSCCRSWRWR